MKKEKPLKNIDKEFKNEILSIIDQFRNKKITEKKAIELIESLPIKYYEKTINR